jgi:ABC-type nitrate/sulfonate/bicarbonate transport system substrate-binding protein
MDLNMDRRKFLSQLAKGGGGAAFLGLGGAGLLAACGSSSSKTVSTPTTAASGGSVSTTPASTGTSTKSLGSANLQLDWIEDIEFAGSYIAKSNGYYTNAGVDVGLLAGGPSTSVEPIVVAGRALVGISGPDLTSAAINSGAKLTMIGAQMQKAPQAIMSLASKPINTPEDMIGKKIGVQAGNLVTFKAFLQTNNISASKITIVPVQFDPSPLASGTVDGWYSFITNEPFLLAAKGVKTKTFLLYDYGYRLYSGTYLCRTSSLSDAKERAQLVALMKGEIQGWEKAFADPALASKLTVDVYGKANGLDIPTQTKELAAYKAIWETSVTAAHGLLWMSPTDVAECVKTLGVGGIKSKTSYFTNEILQEVYQGKATV